MHFSAWAQGSHQFFTQQLKPIPSMLTWDVFSDANELTADWEMTRGRLPQSWRQYKMYSFSIPLVEPVEQDWVCIAYYNFTEPTSRSRLKRTFVVHYSTSSNQESPPGRWPPIIFGRGLCQSPWMRAIKSQMWSCRNRSPTSTHSRGSMPSSCTDSRSQPVHRSRPLCPHLLHARCRHHAGLVAVSSTCGTAWRKVPPRALLKWWAATLQ